MKFSIIIPAYNEEDFIVDCIESISKAAEPYTGEIEIIVVLNRCTDRTEEIAVSYGARITREDSKNLSKIRNAGAKLAEGEIIVTIDADSRMSANMLTEIEKVLGSGKYIGGGVPVLPERYSLGIRTTMFLLNMVLWLAGLTGGLYWCYRRDFEAIGGFNEDLLMGEDLDFAKRLKEHGKKKNLKLLKLRNVHIITSMRKLDKFGDWYFLWLMISASKDIKRTMHGDYKDEHIKLADKYFYEFGEKNNKRNNSDV